MSNAKFFFIGSGIAVILLGWGLFLVMEERGIVSNVNNALFLDEFDGSYAETEPTGVVHEVLLRADESTVSIANDVSTVVWAYNESVPGPTIRIARGDTLRATLQNDLSQPTTIHWHGVRVPNSMDGVPGLTQEPVMPGEFFVYEFTPPDAGTFWFHPHVRSSEQVEHGLYGVLIVEDEHVTPYTQDIVWVVDDWSLGEDGQLYPFYNTRHDLVHDGRWGNVITVNGQSNEIIRAAPGERIRLRLVNTSNGRVYAPEFASLRADIIAVDGMPLTKPMPAAGFEIAPGNRIDVDITIPTEVSASQYVINDRYTRQVNRLGVVEVQGESIMPSVFPLPLAKHFPDWSSVDPLTPVTEYIMKAGVGGPLGISWTLNDQVFSDSVPTSLARNTFSILRFTNESSRLHPMHLHGQFFTVIARNGLPVDEKFWRDTVLVHGNETVDVAMVPTELGTWALHCHILEHAEAGMMTTIEVS